jgi:hypothetical protein
MASLRICERHPQNTFRQPLSLIEDKPGSRRQKERKEQ